MDNNYTDASGNIDFDKVVNTQANAPMAPQPDAVPPKNVNNTPQAFEVNKPKKTNKSTLIIGIVIAVIILAMGGLTLYYLLDISQRETRFTETAKNLLDRAKNLQSNKPIYFMPELAAEETLQINNPYHRDYLDTSYVSNFHDNTYICLSDGEHLISGTAEKLEFKETTEACAYEFKIHGKKGDDDYYDEAELYAMYYVKNIDNATIDSIEPGEKEHEYYVKNSYGKFSITLKVVDYNHIEAESHWQKLKTAYEEGAGKYYETVIKQTGILTRKYGQLPIGDDSECVIVNYAAIMCRLANNEADARKMTKEMAAYMKENKISGLTVAYYAYHYKDGGGIGTSYLLTGSWDKETDKFTYQYSPDAVQPLTPYEDL